MAATINVTFLRPATNRGAYGVIGDIRVSEEFTGSVSSQSTSNTARVGELVRICTTGGDIKIAVGASPTADSTGMRILDGTTEYINLPDGFKIAILGV